MRLVSGHNEVARRNVVPFVLWSNLRLLPQRYGSRYKVNVAVNHRYQFKKQKHVSF